MTVFIGLGSNLGNRKENINKAIELLKNTKGIKIIKTSSIIETEPYGKTDQPNFLNCVIEINTEINPEHLLEICNKIENELGRIRKEKWGPRTIDLDILFIDDFVIRTPDLVVPHPEVHLRNFVLTSLMEIAPDFIHPVFNKTIKEIYQKL